jgi:hypothetical protein
METTRIAARPHALLTRWALAAAWLLLSACSTATAPAGRAVLEPQGSATSLIALPTGHFDATAPAARGIETLGRSGVPRLERLSPAERETETRIAEAVQRDPAGAVEAARRLAIAAGSPAQPVFEVDAMKYLFHGYGTARAPVDEAQRRMRLTQNHALHPSAVAVARLAFLARLDELQALPASDPARVVFVTSGGCAAGKGDLFAMSRSVVAPGLRFGAVWDAAGEGNALENPWILAAARARGLQVVFGWAEADPATRYDAVLARAVITGRVVDVLTFVNSYTEGSAEFRRFLESPEYRAAEAAGVAVSFGVAPGLFDPASLKDRSRPAYPQARALSRPGEPLTARHLAPPPDRLSALKASLQILEAELRAARASGRATDDLLQGALGNSLKFLDDESPQVGELLREAHARLTAAGR